MHAVIFGAGKIARGFIGHLLHLSGIPFTFIEVNAGLVDLLNRRGGYHIEVMGNPARNAEITGVRAIRLDDHEAAAKAWADAPLAFTCVGGKNLEGLAAHLAELVQRRQQLTSATANLITCENWKEPAALLRAKISASLPEAAAQLFQKNIGLSEAVVMRSAIEPTKEQLERDPLWVSVQDFWELPVDRSRIVGEPVAVEGIRYIDGFSGYLERKFYTYNAANGTASYLGYLRGHKYLFDAANDPWIVAALKGVYDETGRALSAKHGIPLEEHRKFTASSLHKLQDRNIIDYVERNARDPLRKLGPEDRLVGSARLVMQHGIEPKHLARSIAAAIHYAEPADPSAQTLAELLRKGGIDAVLREVCKIDPAEPLGQLVREAELALAREGYFKESAPLADEGIAIQYLGQVGFLFRHHGLTIAIDPYLSYSVDKLDGQPKNFWVRNYPPPVEPGKLHDVDLVLCTHDHLDHTDPETLRAIAAAAPKCLFAGPRVSVEEMKRGGIAAERTICLNEGVPFPFRDVLIEPVAAAHEDYETDAEGFHRYLGYLLHWDGLTFFHAGDTVATPQLSARIKREKIDVAFLPINGVSEERHKAGIIGNMDARAAAQFAREQRIDLVVPTHYDLYSNNGADVGEFLAALAATPDSDAKPKVFQPGEKLVCAIAKKSRELAVIIGAGKTGRGFLARLLGDSPFDIVFIDKSKELVDRINAKGEYKIHFFGGKRPACAINQVRAALPDSPEALEWMTRAKAAFMAVGEQNVAGLLPFLQRALDRRREEHQSKLSLFVCENGVTPSAPLVKALASRADEIEIAGAAIFCSTIELPDSPLDMQSEAYDELPFDVEHLTTFSPLPWMKATPDFPALLKRKIHTYNCFSGCIAYLGAFKGYRWYAEAALDPEISAILDRIAEPLNRAIAKEFGIGIEEQQRFAQAALRKFKDETIRDDIPRNARSVLRKLAPQDRLVAPALLIQENGGSIDALALTIAAALHYRGPDEKELEKLLAEKPVGEAFAQISGCPPESGLNARVVHYFHRLKSGASLLAILDS
jgi:mannitol-1-phosphate 5-dehydrogenase